MNYSLINKIASDEIIDEAYKWLCKSRIDYHYNNDIWHLRSNWDATKRKIQKSILEGNYWFEPVKRIRTSSGFVSLWSSRDALVLKAMTMVLSEYCRPHLGERCYHVSGLGGGKGAVRDVQKQLKNYKFVFRSDVESYYASINHKILIKQIRKIVKEEKVLQLIHGYLNHLEDEDGILKAVSLGIHFGCPLSPLMGAIYLKPLDDAMKDMGVFYDSFINNLLQMHKRKPFLCKVL
ncbi:MAG: hypothetical protein GY714_15100 [Desulfobacterales bacterium]|nr:hypothetical protein [Desulfobacterales bacterium]